MKKLPILMAALFLVLTLKSPASAFLVKGSNGSTLNAEAISVFDQPWAMTFLPDGSLLISTRPGRLFHVTQSGEKREVANLFAVAFGGQGGLGDVVLHPDHSSNKQIYLSYAETNDGGETHGAVVVRARLELDGLRPRLEAVERIWTQKPKLPGRGHYSHRLAFGPNGSDQEGKLFITSGDRQRQYPAQEWDMALGKIIRLNDDGSIPSDNPWQDKGELAKSFWSMGHRNLLGISFDTQGKLWAHEMGPRHGDELNRIIVGKNYGWPIVSNGDNYSGKPIPDHDTRPEFAKPAAYWVPSIAPSGLVIYSGDISPSWQNSAFIGGLVSRAVIQVKLTGDEAREVERFSWGKRIREIEQGPNGALWVLEDRSDGRLIKLTPGG